MIHSSSFDQLERALMANIAQRLLPELGHLAKKWVYAIPLDAPTDKLPRMRKTLEGLTAAILHGFFERLSIDGPEACLQYYQDFLEQLIRNQLGEPERQQATIERLFAASRTVRLMIAEELPRLVPDDKTELPLVQLCFSRLWSEAAETLGLIYSRLREAHLCHLYSEARRTAEALKQSEDRFRLLVEGIEDYAIFMFDQQGFVTSWNPGAECIHGYLAQEIIGRHFSCFYTPEDLTSGKPGMELEAARDDGRHEDEAWRVRKDGSRFFANVIITALHDSEGSLIGFSAITRDITERRRTEERLRQSEQRFRLLIDNAPDCITVIDHNGKIQFQSPSVERALGYRPEERVGKKVADFLHPEDAPIFAEVIQSMRQTANEEKMQVLRLRHKDGSWRTIETIGKLLPPEFGKAECVLNWRDITERYRLEQQLRESETHFRSLIENASDGITIVDRHGLVLFESPSIERLLGYKPEERVGQNIYRFIHPDDVISVRENTRHHKESSDPVRTVVCRFRHKDGSWRFIEANGKWLSNNGQSPLFAKRLCTVFNWRDVTERVKAEEAILASEEKFKRVFDASLEAMSISTWPEGRFVDANQAAFEMFGYQREEWLGHTARELDMWIDPEQLKSFRNEISKQGEMRNFETDFRARDGTIISVLASFVKLKIGEEELLFSTARDISERKHAEVEIMKARDAALEASRLKSAFLANMSHEIRTPLNIILGCSEIMADYLNENGDSSQQPYLDAIARACRRLVGTIHGILDISKIEAGTFEIAPRQLQLTALLERITGDLATLAERKNLALSCEIEQPTATVMFDEYCLTQALINLCDNAIKFTEHGRVATRLYRNEQGVLCIDVRDTGVGISPEYLPRLFQQFSQERLGYTRPFQGSGLGLALTRQYLELNDARLLVRSEKGKGSVFTVLFSSDSENAARSARPGQPMPNAAIQPASPTSQEPSLLIIVEDDMDTQVAIRRQLGEKYKLLFATSANDLRQKLRSCPADNAGLVIMDLALEGNEDGISLTKYLRNLNGWNKIPIVALSAHATPEDRNRALAAGCIDYMPKPVKRTQLLNFVDRVIRKNST